MVHAAWSHNTMVELVLIGRLHGQQIVNVHAFEASAAEEATFLSDSLADASAIALRNDWVTNMQALWLAGISNEYALVTIGSQVVERPATVSHRLGRQDRLPTGTGLGTTATASDAPAVAAVTKWRSLVATRHARGRTYQAGIPEGDTALGKLSAPGVAFRQAYADAMCLRYKPTGAYSQWNFTVYSRPYDSPHGDYTSRAGGTLHVVSKPDYAGNSNFILSGLTDDVLRTQRRREVGVGA
jgi:hypothetical protein